MNKIKCETCRWWNAFTHESGVGEGECHRYPPVFNSAECAGFKDCAQAAFESVSVWPMPVTDAEEWCGEWAAEYLL
jgi:hypothetical protein